MTQTKNKHFSQTKLFHISYAISYAIKYKAQRWEIWDIQPNKKHTRKQ
jgi:hypothetical protein